MKHSNCALQYRCCNATPFYWFKRGQILSAGTVTFLVHICLLQKCSKMLLTYFKKYFKNFSNGIFTILAYEDAFARQYCAILLYMWWTRNWARICLPMDFSGVIWTYLCYEVLQLECWLVHGHLVVYGCQCNY